VRSCSRCWSPHGGLRRRSDHGAALQTTRSLADARKAFVVNAAGDIIGCSRCVVGLALFAYFQLHTLPPISRRQDPAVLHVADLSARIVGLVIASIMASSLSSVDSAINRARPWW